MGHHKGNLKSDIFHKIRKWFLSLGPGIITAALVFGPSKITIASKLGAEYGYTLLWVIVVAIFFMAVFTSMSARIGIATNQSLLTTIRQKWGKRVSVAIGIGIFMVAASFQAGNSIGIGIAIGELTQTSPVQWIVIFNIVAIGLLFFKGFYKTLEKIMMLLVGLMLIAFTTTVVRVEPVLYTVLPGFVPLIPDHSLELIIAFIASSFSVVGAFYQSYLVQERKRINPKVKQSSTDSLTGIIILGIMATIVLLCAATVLFPKGIKLNSATDMAKALEPLFGKNAAKLFLCGLFGASFSALVGNASLGGTLLGDAVGFGNQLNSKKVKYLIAAVMCIGAAIAIIFGKLPLELIILAQSITILIVPFIGITMFAIANDTAIMGKHTSTVTVKIFGFLGLIILILLAAINVKELFF
ncbi:divalent metal cation transporter [Pedobacter sp. BS3]|nr:divalent metal cation transporter [Pedobacter sp. BS3]